MLDYKFRVIWVSKGLNKLNRQERLFLTLKEARKFLNELKNGTSDTYCIPDERYSIRLIQLIDEAFMND